MRAVIAALALCMSEAAQPQVMNTARAPVAVLPPQTKFPGLVTVNALPSPNIVLEIEIPERAEGDITLPRSPPGCSGPSLGPNSFRQLLAKAKPIPADDPSISKWHYAPWCRVAFTTASGKHVAQLFLGGRALLTLPAGQKVMFDYTLPPQPPAL
jgi:hypothetical protein